MAAWLGSSEEARCWGERDLVPELLEPKTPLYRVEIFCLVSYKDFEQESSTI